LTHGGLLRLKSLTNMILKLINKQ